MSKTNARSWACFEADRDLAEGRSGGRGNTFLAVIAENQANTVIEHKYLLLAFIATCVSSILKRVSSLLRG